MTLGRGDGLLGLRPQGPLGPRGDSVTLAQIDWTYTTHAGEGAAPHHRLAHTCAYLGAQLPPTAIQSCLTPAAGRTHAALAAEAAANSSGKGIPA